MIAAKKFQDLHGGAKKEQQKKEKKEKPKQEAKPKVSYSASHPTPGLPQRLGKENGHGKVMEHEKLARNHGMFNISHGILALLPPELYQLCMFFVATIRN